MARVVVVGAAGSTGGELLPPLIDRPEVEVVGAVSSRSPKPKTLLESRLPTSERST